MDDVFVIPESVKFRTEEDPASRLNWLRRFFGRPLKRPRTYRWLEFELGWHPIDSAGPLLHLAYAVPLVGAAEAVDRIGLSANQVEVLSLAVQRLVSKPDGPEEYRTVSREIRALANRLVMERHGAANPDRTVCVTEFGIETG